MATVVEIGEAQSDLAALLDRIQAGEDIMVHRTGASYFRLVPVVDHPLPPRTPGRFKGEFDSIPDSVWFDPLPDDELELWEGKRLDKHFGE